MSCKVVYEKHYPRNYPADDDPTLEEAKRAYRNHSFMDGESFLRKLYGETVRVLIPDRTEDLKKFLGAAKKVADYYEMDIIIKAFNDHYAISLHAEPYRSLFGMKTLVLLADNMEFSYEDNEMILTLNFYTHATYLSGRKISPCEDCIDLFGK